MKSKKISIQKGLNDIEQLLVNSGYEVVSIGQNDDDAAVTIFTGVDNAYEEIEPAQCRFSGDSEHEMLVINASGMTPDQVLNLIKNNHC